VDRLTGYLAMHQASGVRATLPTGKDIAAVLEVAKRRRAEGALLSIEEPNELTDPHTQRLSSRFAAVAGRTAR
jgi:hypothetical protein